MNDFSSILQAFKRKRETQRGREGEGKGREENKGKEKMGVVGDMQKTGKRYKRNSDSKIQWA